MPFGHWQNVDARSAANLQHAAAVDRRRLHCEQPRNAGQMVRVTMGNDRRGLTNVGKRTLASE
jgi:hypothetical protein